MQKLGKELAQDLESYLGIMKTKFLATTTPHSYNIQEAKVLVLRWSIEMTATLHFINVFYETDCQKVSQAWKKEVCT